MTHPARIWLIFTMLAAQLAIGRENSSDHWAILPTNEGKELVGQCSRDCPFSAKTFWRPSASQVAAIEQRLPNLLRTSGHKIDLPHSYRQYLGIVLNGKNLIYINAFDSLTMADFRASWRNKALIICDGGDMFWGVEFDPATNTFQHFAFNGAI